MIDLTPKTDCVKNELKQKERWNEVILWVLFLVAEWLCVIHAGHIVMDKW